MAGFGVAGWAKIRVFLNNRLFLLSKVSFYE